MTCWVKTPLFQFRLDRGWQLNNLREVTHVQKVLIDLSRVEQKVITITEFFEIKSQMNTREDTKISYEYFPSTNNYL